MPTSDNDKTSAVKKVVDAFRARRAGEQVPDDQAAKSTAPRTPVVKIEPGQALGGGGAEAPTQAFAVPAALTESAGEVTEEIVTDEVVVAQESVETSDDTTGEEATETEVAETVEIESAESESGETDAASGSESTSEESAGAADDPAADEDADGDSDADDAQSAPSAAANDVEVTAGGIAHETVVAVDGAGDRAEVPPRSVVESVHPDELDRPGIVEQRLDLTPGDDATDTAQIELPEQAQTDTIEVAGVAAAAAGAAAATGTAATGTAGAGTAGAGATTAPVDDRAGEWSSTPHQPEVIAPTTPPAQTKSRAKLWALLAALVALIVAGFLIWWFVFHTSPQNRAADAARTYQTAMNDGDLSTLQSITCGEDQQYYQSVSPEEFHKAFESQQARNQMMAFKNVTGVAIDGDTARVGVEVYSKGEPDVTTSAQITLHRIDGDWKVCGQP